MYVLELELRIISVSNFIPNPIFFALIKTLWDFLSCNREGVNHKKRLFVRTEESSLLFIIKHNTHYGYMCIEILIRRLYLMFWLGGLKSSDKLVNRIYMVPIHISL